MHPRGSVEGLKGPDEWCDFTSLGPVVQKMYYEAINWINRNLLDNAIGFPNTSPVDSAIQRFNQLSPYKALQRCVKRFDK